MSAQRKEEIEEKEGRREDVNVLFFVDT